ncbi:AAA family ATPase [Agromyces agglutinans]|nr:AAA family ATPase [Agromyces agglutinans]
MAEASIRRIAKIGNYRAFRSWSDDGTAKQLGRVNVLYGTNGSGKSTLASLFRDCSDPETVPVRAAVQLEVEIAGVATTVTELDPEFWSRVRVFNADYVRDNLRFDDDEGPRSDSLLTLGKPNVDAENELRDAEARKLDLIPQAADARAEANAADRLLQRRMTELAGEIVEDLRQSPIATYRATNTYTKANVRKLLEGDRSAFEGASKDIAADRALANSSPMRSVPPIPFPPELSDDATLEAVKALIAEHVAVTALEELRGHPDRADWVQAGLPLHSDRDTCLFCGHEISASRRELLAAHFDDALTAFQHRVDRTVAALTSSVESSQQVASAIPGDGELYPDLAGALREARSNYRDAHDQYSASVAALVPLLHAKRGNPFEKLSIPVDLQLEPPPRAEIEAVVQQHSTRREEHDSSASKAARRVELARVLAFADEYDSRVEELEAKETSATRLSEELGALTQRIIALQNVSADPVPTAEVLTRDVERLLGRGDLQFQTTEDGKHYRIEREGAPATHLSEGERTAIALLHFLASIRREVSPGDEPIVVIDDPVSSLDDSILFGVSSFLWSALVSDSFASQVILFTHNFELFRQWIIQLDNARRHIQGGYTVHEIRMRYRPQRSGPPRRVPQLDPWTEDHKQSRRLRSLYHYLFARVATAVIEASSEVSLAERMDLLALAPNAARKMMEAFLSFRYPQHIGDFHAGMRDGMQQVASPAIRTHVERYLHAYSHNEEGNVSAMVDPSEATAVIRSLFSMMRAIDAQHLSSMCEALLIDETELFAVPGRHT